MLYIKTSIYMRFFQELAFIKFPYQNTTYEWFTQILSAGPTYPKLWIYLTHYISEKHLCYEISGGEKYPKYNKK
jgi:hypothetical protein